MRNWKARVLATGIAAASLFVNPQSADAHRSKLVGTLSTHQVECDSLCTAGPLTGGLAGGLEFTMDSMQETGNPDVVTYRGVNTITTEHGTLEGADFGVWNLVTGEFVDFTVFSHGTGDYEGVHGTLVIIGAFDPATGIGHSRYVSVLR